MYRFLANELKDVDLRKWAVEGLAYLTLDAEIKEELVKDEAAIQALVDIAKVSLDIWHLLNWLIWHNHLFTLLK